MVKKALNPLKIDFKKCIVEDCLLQIRNEKNLEEPELSMFRVFNDSLYLNY